MTYLGDSSCLEMIFIWFLLNYIARSSFLSGSSEIWLIGALTCLSGRSYVIV